MGPDAQSLAPMLGETPIASPIPLPLSAVGLLWVPPFSRANTALVAQGAEPIQWCLP